MGWRMRSVQSYHTMMNLLLLPMWLLSGSIFPSAGAARWMQTVMAINPLTYGDAALRRMLYLGQPELQGSLPGLTLSIAVIAGFGVFSFGLAVVAVGGRNREGGP
jgi:ABC-2 type transport system permease protein